MLKRKYLAISSAATAILLVTSGCTTTSQRDTASVSNETKAAASLDARATALNEKEAELAKREAALAATANKPVAVMGDSLLPPAAKPGECYARVWVEPSYKTRTKTIKVKDEDFTVTTIPAKYEWGSERVLVKEASSKLIETPAIYETKKERIQISDAQRIWKVALGKNAAPASNVLLDAAKKGGIDLDAARPGMCFHEHYHPAKFTSEEVSVLDAEASEKVEVDSAKYRTVEKQIMISPASSKLVEVPAQYETVTETVIDVPAHTIWKKGTGPIQRLDEATGEIMCLVEVPATYKKITKQVLKSEATTKRVDIPAQYETVKVRELVEDAVVNRTKIPARYKTVKVTKQTSEPTFVWHEIHNREEPKKTRTGNKICLTEIPAQYRTVTSRVVKTPASTRKVEIPAEYKTIKVRKLVSEAKEVRHKVPAQFKDVTYKEILKDGHMEWRSILCETNMTQLRIADIQRALKKQGYNPGPIDGVIDTLTMKAVNDFQRAKGLPVDRYLNIKTLQALGVSPK